MKESILSKYSNTNVTLCHAHEIICRTTEFFPPKNSCPKYTTVGVKVPVLNWKKIISGNYAWSEDREGGWLLTVLDRVLSSRPGEDLLSLLTEVCGDVATREAFVSNDERTHRKKSTACVYHKLFKDICFPAPNSAI